MSALYPVLLDLAGARVLVVGGGEVAMRRLGALVAHDGRPDIIAPATIPALTELAERHGLAVYLREYETGDASGYRLVIAATDRPEVNLRVARDATAAGAWVNVVDHRTASTFQVPAVVQRDEVMLAVSTGGAAPLLARRLRERLEGVVTPGLGRAARRVGSLRERVHERWPADEARRRAFWFALITEEFLDSAIAGRDDDIENSIEVCLSQS